MPALSITSRMDGFAIAPCSHITDTNASALVRETVNAEDFEWPYYADMPDKPAHYLRQWRHHRKMTQQQLADAIETSKSAISDLETFRLQLSPKWLTRLAP